MPAVVFSSMRGLILQLCFLFFIPSAFAVVESVSEYRLPGGNCPFVTTSWSTDLNATLLSFPTFINGAKIIGPSACAGLSSNMSNSYAVLGYVISGLTITTTVKVTRTVTSPDSVSSAIVVDVRSAEVRGLSTPNCVAGDTSLNGVQYSAVGFLDYICASDRCVHRVGDSICTADNVCLMTLSTNTGVSCSTPPLSTPSGASSTSSGASSTSSSRSLPPAISSTTSTSTTTTTPTGSITSTTSQTVSNASTSAGQSSTIEAVQSVASNVQAGNALMGNIEIKLDGVNRETTQLEVLGALNATNSPTAFADNMLSSSQLTSDLSAKNLEVQNLVSGLPVSMNSDSSIAWWSWTPNFGAGVCSPFSKTIYGKLIVLDLCSWIAMIRDSIGWLFSIYSAWSLFGLTFRRTA